MMEVTQPDRQVDRVFWRQWGLQWDWEDGDIDECRRDTAESHPEREERSAFEFHPRILSWTSRPRSEVNS